ncbi:hypothetical protein K439DRAFT_1635079 [Ramaria rubella]|nr:hypothetical protein K439DRAFT_1635079 [Ramaria rubella]
MSFPTGVLDGSFVKFEGFDVNLHDVGNFFPDLSGQAKIDALKTATLEPGALWFVFNSNGWAKTWTNISPSDFIQSNSTLYIQIEFPGWVFTQGERIIMPFGM